MTVILNNKVRTWVTKLVIGFSMGHRHGSISQKQDRLFGQRFFRWSECVLMFDSEEHCASAYFCFLLTCANIVFSHRSVLPSAGILSPLLHAPPIRWIK